MWSHNINQWVMYSIPISGILGEGGMRVCPLGYVFCKTHYKRMLVLANWRKIYLSYLCHTYFEDRKTMICPDSTKYDFIAHLPVAWTTGSLSQSRKMINKFKDCYALVYCYQAGYTGLYILFLDFLSMLCCCVLGYSVTT